MLPRAGLHPGFPEEKQLQISIPATTLYAVAKKMVRGCEYVLVNRNIEKPYELAIYFVHERNVPAVGAGF
jgi:hypothetical protein